MELALLDDHARGQIERFLLSVSLIAQYGLHGSLIGFGPSVPPGGLALGSCSIPRIRCLPRSKAFAAASSAKRAGFICGPNGEFRDHRFPALVRHPTLCKTEKPFSDLI
jgi:hypothetical protein